MVVMVMVVVAVMIVVTLPVRCLSTAALATLSPLILPRLLSRLPEHYEIVLAYERHQDSGSPTLTQYHLKLSGGDHTRS